MILSPNHIVVLLVAMESVNVQNPDRNPVIFSIACKIRKYKNMFLFNKKIQFYLIITIETFTSINIISFN